MTALAKLNGVASNPAGVAACYNIPSYDNVTGAFQADLRLYQISPPASSWATLIHQGVSVGLTFPNGTMAAQQSSKIIKRDDSMLSWPPIRHIVGRKIVERASSPQLLSNMTLAGQVGTGMMSYYKDPIKMKTALMPIIILSAKSQNGSVTNTTISSTEASFVTGVFSSSSSVSQAGFILPGTKLGIFPTGLIITGTWTVLFVLTIGWGTMHRIKFREAYRRRMRRGLNMGLRTM
ncbi:hypothetical protein MMC09_005085 [Bachmanniomyces sp. S44760]|nr:hypothetical protein [Bachmanniomyces sp. S44760]